MNLIMILIGGFMGTSLRYLLTIGLQKYKEPFPLGILIVNLSGSALIGIISAINLNHSPHLQWLLVTGGLGSFTTFSTFSVQSLELFLDKAYKKFIIYTLLSVGGSVIICFSCFQLVKIFF